MKDKLLQIINYYGLDKQLKYIHSEYFELDEAILNYQNSGWDFDYEDAEQLEREYKHHIAEELADIQVMLKQFQYYFDIEDEEIKKSNIALIERVNNLDRFVVTDKKAIAQAERIKVYKEMLKKLEKDLDIDSTRRSTMYEEVL